VFWLTFLPAGGQSEKAKTTTVEKSAEALPGSMIQNKEKVQLNWSDYYQGKWSARKFGQGDAATLEFDVSADFKRSQIFIHASKKEGNNGREGAVRVNLNVHDQAFSILGFRMISKLEPPVPGMGDGLDIASPFNAYPGQHPTRHQSKAGQADGLTVSFHDTTTESEPGRRSVGTISPQILKRAKSFQLLTHTHPNPSLYKDPVEKPAAMEEGVLVSPFFYIDDESLFFVEPSLRVKSVIKWESWGLPPATRIGIDASRLKELGAYQQTVQFAHDPISPLVTQSFSPLNDWVTKGAASVQFNSQSIGKAGGVATIPVASTNQP
jgi:hypothetical protein